MTYIQMSLSEDPYYENLIVSFLRDSFPEDDLLFLQNPFLEYLCYFSNDQREIRALAALDSEERPIIIRYLCVSNECRNSGMAKEFLKHCEYLFGSYELELLASYEDRIHFLLPGKYFISNGIKLTRMRCEHRVVHFGSGDPEFEEVKKIRFAVFVDEQGYSDDEELDQFEEDSLHFLLYRNNVPVACSRIRKVENEFKIERVAVLQNSRKRNIGQELMKNVLSFIREKSGSESDHQSTVSRNVFLFSQEYCIPFYEELGFKAEGEIFDECGQPHQKMTLQLQ